MNSRTLPASFVKELTHLEQRLGTTTERLEYFASELNRSRLIRKYSIQSGANWRVITQPTDEGLKNIHRRMLGLLIATIDLPDHVNGYVRGRSTLTNAFPHIGHRYLQRFDLNHFFDHVTRDSVIAGLQSYGFCEVIATMLARLTTVDGILPTGFSTSPAMANIAMASFDRDLADLASAGNLSVTRYADDIVLSSDELFNMDNEIAQLCVNHGHVLNIKKSRTLKHGQPLYVTGLSTSETDRPRLPRPFKKRLRQELYYVERYGFESHAQRGSTAPDKLRTRLGGQLAYAKSIEPDFIGKLTREYPNAIAKLYRGSSTKNKEKRTERLLRLADRIKQRSEARAPLYTPTRSWLN